MSVVIVWRNRADGEDVLEGVFANAERAVEFINAEAPRWPADTRFTVMSFRIDERSSGQ